MQMYVYTVHKYLYIYIYMYLVQALDQISIYIGGHISSFISRESNWNRTIALLKNM
jgi:hypothetical protein